MGGFVDDFVLISFTIYKDLLWVLGSVNNYPSIFKFDLNGNILNLYNNKYYKIDIYNELNFEYTIPYDIKIMFGFIYVSISSFLCVPLQFPSLQYEHLKLQKLLTCHVTLKYLFSPGNIFTNSLILY